MGLCSWERRSGLEEACRWATERQHPGSAGDDGDDGRGGDDGGGGAYARPVGSARGAYGDADAEAPARLVPTRLGHGHGRGHVRVRDRDPCHDPCRGQNPVQGRGPSPIPRALYPSWRLETDLCLCRVRAPLARSVVCHQVAKAPLVAGVAGRLRDL